MALRRVSYSALAAALMLAAAASVSAVKKTSTEREPASDSQGSSREPLRAVDPNEGGAVDGPSFPSLAVAGGTAGCTPIGAFDDQFAFGSAYRGDAVRFERAAQLNAFTMELKFSGTTTLHFSLHRRDPEDGRYKRVVPDVVLSNVVGSGGAPADPPVIYSTGPLPNPVTLTPGDYAFGVSWGSAVSVGFGRAARFERTLIPGVAESLGTVNLGGTSPPIADSLSLTPISSFGLYSMEICLEPEAGACCRAAAETCEVTLETECDGTGDFFAGQFTTCEEVICRVGACCCICQDCQSPIAEGECLAQGGTFHLNTDCPEDEAGQKRLCPGVTGACCTGARCAEVCAANCGPENFLGVGTRCQPDGHTCAGACWLCDLGVCRQRSRRTCEETLLGDYRGPDSTCVRPPPEEQCGGACCVYLDGTIPARCTNVDSREACLAPPKVPGEPDDVFIYLGDGRIGDDNTCPSAECPGTVDDRRACCLPEGECIDVDLSRGTPHAQDICEEMGGELNSSFKCNDMGFDCRARTTYGACCFPDGSCENLMKSGCEDFRVNGISSATTLCAPDTCTLAGSFVGACCDTDAGVCEVTTELVCNDSGRFFQGVGTDCTDASATCPGIGACCRINGECFDDVRADDCEGESAIFDGTYQGDGTRCDELDPGCSELHPCCTVGGECVLATQTECDDINGVFNSELSQCAADTCSSGACCRDDGSCVQRRSADLCQDPDIFLGLGTQCEVDVCVRGACCRGNGTCEESQIEQNCVGENDIFTPNATCDVLDPPCTPVAACCFVSGTCVELRANECEELTGTFQGEGVACSSQLCTRGACCLPDRTCFDDEFPESCENLGGQFHPGLICSIDRPCDPRGACCDGSVCIDNLRPAECQFEGGAFQGDGTTCGLESCPIGACCRPGEGDSFVCDETFESDCLTEGEEFHDAPTTCEDRPCDPTGACCFRDPDGVPVSCEERPALLCTPDPDGGFANYRGDGTTCDDCAACLPDTITLISPPDCSIDPAYPHDPSDSTARLGVSSVEIEIDCDIATLDPDDFATTVLPGPAAIPRIIDIIPVGKEPTSRAQLVFDIPIPPGQWTCFREDTLGPDAARFCVGALPGDVSGNGVATAQEMIEMDPPMVTDSDLGQLVDHLFGNPPEPLPLERCDIDRNGQCHLRDLLALIDLFMGAGELVEWEGAVLTECPSTAGP